MNPDLSWSPAVELARLIRTGEISPVELVSHTLERIEAVNERINAFCFVYPEDAMARAGEAERRARSRVSAPLPPLHGVPIAIKDFTPTRGQATTLGSRVFADWVPDWQPVIVDRLLAAGAIVVGKTTTPEFAGAGFTQLRRVHGQIGERHGGHASLGKAVPGDERHAGNAYQPGCQAHHTVRRRHQSQVVLLYEAAQRLRHCRPGGRRGWISPSSVERQGFPGRSALRRSGRSSRARYGRPSFYSSSPGPSRRWP